MATIEQLSSALINADAAGDADAARMLAAELVSMRGQPETAKVGGDLSANNVVRSTANGIPIIGGALNQMNAATNAALAPVLNPLFAEKDQLKGATFADRRAESLRQQQGMDRDFAEQHPVIDTAAQIAGGVGGTLPMMLAAPAAFGAGAGSMTARSFASMLTGGALGGADSAVRSGGDMSSTATGALISSGLGAATPAAAAGIGKGVSYLADKVGGFSRPTGPIAGLPRPAVSYALDSIGDPAKQTILRAELQRLGPQAMLADVSPDWMGVARGAASRPGMRDEIVNPLLARDAAKNTRLRGDLDASLGPVTAPSQITGQIEAGQGSLVPQYAEAFRNARAVDTTPIAHALETDAINLRGPAQRAVQDVRRMLNVVGERDVLDPNPYTLFQTRQAIDGLMANEANPQVTRVLGSARRQIDDTLARSVSGIKDVDAQFAELARQQSAIGRGQQVLDSGRTAPRPQELADEVFQSANPQGQMVGPSAVPFRLRQGARAEVDRVVGTSANDPAAMQRPVKSEGDWNRDRLRTLFGSQKADNALGSIDRETQFYRTSNRVTSGSDTAMANRFGSFLDNAATPNAIPTDTTLFGAMLRGGQKAAQATLGSNAEAKAGQFAKDLGRLSVAQGPERDIIMDALIRAAQGRQSLEPLTAATERIAHMIMNGARPAASQRLQGR